MELPELGDTAESVRENVKTLVPWLPKPFECPNCSRYCDAVVTYDPHMVEYTDAWRCPECSNEFYREGE